MKTIWLLAARYDGIPVVPVESVVKDFFPHLTVDYFIRKVARGAIDLLSFRRMGHKRPATACPFLILPSTLTDE